MRTLDLLLALKNGGFDTHFASAAEDQAAPGGKREPISPRLTQAGICPHAIQLNDVSFEAWIKDLAPNLVIFDRFVIEEQYGARVRAVLPRAVRVIDTQDLHFLRRDREAALSARGGDDSKLRELAAILRSDLSLLVSNFEAELLRELGVRESKFLVTPLSVDLATIQPSEWLPPRERTGFVFVGNHRHPPNEDAVAALAEGFWQEILKEMPDATLTLIGAYPTPKLEKLVRNLPRVKSLGFVTDLRAELATKRVLLAPLRFGAGMKGKVLEAWAGGVAVATTQIGAEGFASPFAGHLLPERLDQDAARKLVAFYRDEDLLRQCQKDGFQALEKSHARTINGKFIEQQLKRLIESIDSVRTQDWLGQVLWREQFRSTEFFSRWLEAKSALAGKPGTGASS